MTTKAQPLKFIDKNFPAVWRVLPPTARVQIRNAIVGAVRTQEVH